jgi:radical SAM superfamily enzyme YgiQ (UPF0313 family)
MVKKLSKNDLIVLVEPQPTQFGELGGDPSYDIYTAYRLAARGIHYVGAAARQAGFLNVAYLSQHHGNINSFENRKKLSEATVIGVSSITRTDPQAMKLLDQYRDKITFAGGFGPSFRFVDYSKHADIVLTGEAEETIPELLLTLTGERGSLEDVDGIVFERGNQTVMTHKRKLLTPERLSVIHPDYDQTTLEGLRTFPLEDSRGCPKDCRFCTVTKAYGGSFRNKSEEWMGDEIIRSRASSANYVFMTGDNFIADRKRAKKVLEHIIENGLNDKRFVFQSTIQLADDEELMKLLWKAGARAVCLGIESIDDEVLKAMNKGYSAQRVIESVKKIREYGFWVHGMFILGEDHDDAEKCKELSLWAPRNVDSAQFFALIPLPGSDVEAQFKAEKRLIYPKGNEHFYLYEGDHVLFKPKNFKNAFHLQKILYEMYENFYSLTNGIKRVFRLQPLGHYSIAAGLLAYTRYSGKEVLHSPQSREHARYLESLCA